MKKLSIGKLKLLSEEVLQRSQLATIYGGYGGSCCVHYRDANGSYQGRECGYDYSTASDWYDSGVGDGHYYVSGYCCASC